jgi:hypothetical protein
MDGLGMRHRTEQARCLGKAFILRLFGVSQVLAIGLALSGKGYHQVIVDFGHMILLMIILLGYETLTIVFQIPEKRR